MWAIFIICIIILLYMIFSFLIHPFIIENDYKRKYGAIENYITFDETSNTLTVNKRCPYIKRYLWIRKDNSIQVNYKPEKIHVGAVSVGGVTTGGAYKTGGYAYDKLVESGYYQLLFSCKEGLLMVKHIQLNAEIYEKAEHSLIAPYLNEKKQQIDVVAPIDFTENEKVMMLNEFKWNGYVGDIAKKGYPSKEKCEQILDWLSEEDE